MGTSERKIVQPQELLEILHYYTNYGDESPEEIKRQDLVTLAKECLSLREALEEVLSVDISRIQTDNRSVVAIEAMRKAAEHGLGRVVNKHI